MVHWQDGSYSRGPVDIPVGEFDDSKYFLSPTYKFEQVRLTFLFSDVLLTQNTLELLPVVNFISVTSNNSLYKL